MNDVLTVEEVAGALKVSRATVRRWCASGRLPAFRIGREWRIEAEPFSRLVHRDDERRGPADGREGASPGRPGAQMPPRTWSPTSLAERPAPSPRAIGKRKSTPGAKPAPAPRASEAPVRLTWRRAASQDRPPSAEDLGTAGTFVRQPINRQRFAVPTGRLHIVPDRCKECGFCWEMCPRQALEQSAERNAKGYRYPQLRSEGEAVCCDCGLCAWICPEFAIYSTDEATDAAAQLEISRPDAPAGAVR